MIKKHEKRLEKANQEKHENSLENTKYSATFFGIQSNIFSNLSPIYKGIVCLSLLYKGKEISK